MSDAGNDTGGTWLTLPLVGESGFRGYRPQSRPLPTPFPNDLVPDVPGDEYPGFPSVPMIALQDLDVRVPTDDDGVAADTGFRWGARASDEARVETARLMRTHAV